MQVMYQAPCVELSKIENLWFQLSTQSCNLRCKHCYLGCQPNNKKKYFLKLSNIFEILQTANLNELKNIYLTGGEPFVHSEIFNIIKLCLKKGDVTILTNGTLISEKKIKILKNIEENSPHKLKFRVSIDYWTEGKNDEFRGKGVFKKSINTIMNLKNYGFNVQICAVNIKNNEAEFIKENFKSMFEKLGIKFKSKDIKVVPMLLYGDNLKYQNSYYEKFIVEHSDLNEVKIKNLDCRNSRVVSVDGVYSCPALVLDPRGKLGESLSNSSRKMFLETQNCYNCVNNSTKLFCDETII